MCRSSSPLFGAPVSRRFSRNEFERRFRQSRAFCQEEMGSGGHKCRCGGFDWYETVEPRATVSRWICCHVSLALRGCGAV